MKRQVLFHNCNSQALKTSIWEIVGFGEMTTAGTYLLLAYVCMDFFGVLRRIREELATQSAETSNLTNKLDRVSGSLLKWVFVFSWTYKNDKDDNSSNLFVTSIVLLYFSGSLHWGGLFVGFFWQEIHTLKTQLEAAKYDVIKYCIGNAPHLNQCVAFCSSYSSHWIRLSLRSGKVHKHEACIVKFLVCSGPIFH